MIKLLKKIFSKAPEVNYAVLYKAGAIILDVRTPSEYTQGHIKGSMNIPLQSLEKGISKLNKEKVIITCCASGMRSESARKMLLSLGWNQVYNGGGWQSLNQKIHS